MDQKIEQNLEANHLVISKPSIIIIRFLETVNIMTTLENRFDKIRDKRQIKKFLVLLRKAEFFTNHELHKNKEANTLRAYHTINLVII